MKVQIEPRNKEIALSINKLMRSSLTNFFFTEFLVIIRIRFVAGPFAFQLHLCSVHIISTRSFVLPKQRDSLFSAFENN